MRGLWRNTGETGLRDRTYYKEMLATFSGISDTPKTRFRRGEQRDLYRGVTSLRTYVFPVLNVAAISADGGLARALRVLVKGGWRGNCMCVKSPGAGGRWGKGSRRLTKILRGEKGRIVRLKLSRE